MKELLYIYGTGFVVILFVVISFARDNYNPKNSDPLLVQALIILSMSLFWFVLLGLLIWSLSTDLVNHLRPKLSKSFPTLSLYLSCQQARFREGRREKKLQKAKERREWLDDLYYQKGSYPTIRV